MRFCTLDPQYGVKCQLYIVEGRRKGGGGGGGSRNVFCMPRCPFDALNVQ